MLDLINRNENKTMTSLEVAEITGKKHKNIIKDETDKLGVEIGRNIFEPSYYINSYELLKELGYIYEEE